MGVDGGVSVVVAVGWTVKVGCGVAVRLATVAVSVAIGEGAGGFVAVEVGEAPLVTTTVTVLCEATPCES